MLEILVCSLVTVVPDYIFRRYAQGKRIGHEITFFSVWYELRWGIASCFILTVSLITMIFYFHPMTGDVNVLYRTVTILPVSNGRVVDVFVKNNDHVEAGAPLFQLDSSLERAAVAAAKGNLSQVDAALAVAKAQLTGADGLIQEAQATLEEARIDEVAQVGLRNLKSGIVVENEVKRAESRARGAQGALTSAIGAKATLEEQINLLLPAQRESAVAALDKAQSDLNNRTVHAGVAGIVEQFALRPGDVVNQAIRPAGILVPSDAELSHIAAGFSQLAAQVIKVGMLGEVACSSNPFVVTPVIVREVQDAIAGGQFRPTDQLIDIAQTQQTGTVTVYMDALYPGDLSSLPPGSSCVAVAYTNFGDQLQSDKSLTPLQGTFMHVIDTTAVLKAMILRLKALLLPVQSLVLSGH